MLKMKIYSELNKIEGAKSIIFTPLVVKSLQHYQLLIRRTESGFDSNLYVVEQATYVSFNRLSQKKISPRKN